MPIPPFEQVIKSRDVEDPVNVWVHRPLAYAFVWLTYRTPLTPNQITLLAMLAGVSAGVCWVLGTPELMLIGGALLWTSSILDGADGIMARAKQMQSEFGRALDGTADGIVAAATIFPAFWHIWQSGASLFELALMPIALVCTVLQVNMYDFYKELYMGAKGPVWPDLDAKFDEITEKARSAEETGEHAIIRFAWSSYASMLRAQRRNIRITNRAALEGANFVPISEESAALYRRINYVPMQLWTALSLCPHTYVMAICAMFDRLDLYLWIRALGANGLFATAIVLQRIATQRTIAGLKDLGTNQHTA